MELWLLPLREIEYLVAPVKGAVVLLEVALESKSCFSSS